MSDIVLVIAFIAVVIFAICTLFGMVFTVKQQTYAIVERFGKYVDTAGPGLNFKLPYVDHVVARISTKVQQVIVEVDTKTKDDVFVKVSVAVQFNVIEGYAADSYYKLQNHVAQITSFVLDVVRAQVPAMTLDEVFVKKNDVGHAVKAELDMAMQPYGFEIPNALVTDVSPDESVKHAMNEIQTQTRLQTAANAKGEANKILLIKNAEGEAEAKKLQGEGIANQRKAIITGLSESVEAFKDKVKADGVDAQSILSLVLITQYFDTMRAIGESGNSKVILMPHSPAGAGDLMSQIRNSIITGTESTAAPASATPLRAA